jgi:NAD(P)-dependent dehydrogenase (short-subunit alcohol dehydrogenase family)
VIQTRKLLADKVAVVTGSTKGIGFSISKEFAEKMVQPLLFALEMRSKQIVQ